MSKLDWALGIAVLIAIIAVIVDIIFLVCAYFVSVQFIKAFIICWIIGLIFAVTATVLGVINVKRNK